MSGGSTSDGAAIQQLDPTYTSDQEWQITSQGNGYNEILNVNSGKVLDVTGVSTSNGALIQQYDWLGGSNQKWEILSDGSGLKRIANLNSGKVLDVVGSSDASGAAVQQWDWLRGLNQQWEIRPAPSGYQASSQTNVYYDSSGNDVYAVGSIDLDYTSQQDYQCRITTDLSDNGNVVDVNGKDQAGYASTYTFTSGSAGHYYAAVTSGSLVASSTYQEQLPDCADYCGTDYYYDPFGFSFVLGDPDEVDIIFETTVWAPPIVAVAATLGSVISLGRSGSGMTVPGNRGIFSLSLRQFIPAPWIRGPGFPLDFCGSGQTPYYKGDNRSYDPISPNYRATSTAVVSSASGSSVSLGSYQGGSFSNPSVYAGITRRYGSDALASDGHTLLEDSVLHDCHYTDWTGPLRRNKRLRHCWPFDEKESTGEMMLAQNDLRLAKRKRTLLESNPPRNSQLETHRDDEAGGGMVAAPGQRQADRIERFPDA